MTELRDALRHIGGPNAVTWQAFIVSYALSLAAYFAGNSQTTPSTWGWVISVSIAQVAAFTPLVVARLTFLRDAASRPRPWAMLGLFVLASVIRGVLVAFLLRTIAGDPNLHLLYRIFGGMPSIVLALSLTAVIIGAAREHHTRLAQLAHLNESLTEARARTEVAVAAEQAVVVERIAQDLQDQLDDIDPDRPHESAATLHRLATDVVRPLSHQLAKDVPTWTPTPAEVTPVRIRPWQVIAQLPVGKPFMPLTTATALAANVVGYGVVTYGVPRMFPILFMTFAAPALGLTAFNAIMQVIPEDCPKWVRPTAFVGSVLLAGALAGGYATLVVPDSGDLQRTVPGSVLYTMGFTVMFAMIKADWEIQQEVVASVERQGEELRWSVARARQVQWHQQRSLSRVLHGPVQSALNAAAMRLDEALQADAPLAPIVGSVEAELRRVLASALRADDTSASLQRAIDEIVALWSGLCDISIDVSPTTLGALAQDDVCRTAVVDVLIKGSSNAIRHGKATRLRMRVTALGSRVRVISEDNGSAAEEQAAQGLGSRLLDECAVSWQRTAGASGNVLTADLPLVAASAEVR